MVAGTYTKGSGSRSKPYQLHYAPSHAERPHGRSSREKGRGWQRSKSTAYDYGSELYFGEDRALHRYGRRAQSSMSERRTYKNSNSEEFECPAQKQPKRRASVEAHIRATRSSSDRAKPKNPIGPPIQKRMQTVRPDSARECITPNKALTGWAQADKDLTFQKVNIENKEGPQARPYTPKYDPPGADVIQFPSIEPEAERKYECRQRRMDMLIYTGLFKERYPAFGDKGGFPFEDDGEPYPNTSTLQISPKSSASKFLSEIRLELESFEVPENRIMKGRICFDLMEPITVDSIEFDINKTLVMVTKDGKIITPRRDASASVTKLKLLPSRQPKPYIPELATPEEVDENEGKTRPPYDFVLPNTYRKTVGLNLDRKCIPFEIYIPENIVPSFSYVAPNGGSVVNNYSVEATIRTCGSTERVGLVPITVPALGKEGDPGYGLGDDIEVVMPNRCFTNQEGFDYAVGWIDGDANTPKPKSISARVIQIVKCSAISADSSVIHELGSVNMASGDSNSVFDQYKLNPKSKAAKDNWGANAASQDNTTQFTTPSVSTEGFTCDYILEIEADSKTFSGAVILCDRLSKNDLKRTDLSPISRRNDFRLKR